MPQVAFELNKEGVLTKKGMKWNARAVRDVLTNEIYMGKHKVAGVNNYVEEYRILDDSLFKTVNETRLRYKRGGAERHPTPEDRRTAKIERVFSKYLELLEDL